MNTGDITATGGISAGIFTGISNWSDRMKITRCGSWITMFIWVARLTMAQARMPSNTVTRLRPSLWTWVQARPRVWHLEHPLEWSRIFKIFWLVQATITCWRHVDVIEQTSNLVNPSKSQSLTRFSIQLLMRSKNPWNVQWISRSLY